MVAFFFFLLVRSCLSVPLFLLSRIVCYRNVMAGTIFSFFSPCCLVLHKDRFPSWFYMEFDILLGIPPFFGTREDFLCHSGASIPHSPPAGFLPSLGRYQQSVLSHFPPENTTPFFLQFFPCFLTVKPVLFFFFFPEPLAVAQPFTHLLHLLLLSRGNLNFSCRVNLIFPALLKIILGADQSLVLPVSQNTL